MWGQPPSVSSPRRANRGGLAPKNGRPLLSCRSRIPFRLHLSAPLLGILLVHLLHCFCRFRVVARNMPHHRLHHLVPRPSRQLLITRTAKLFACHRFHASLNASGSARLAIIAHITARLQGPALCGPEWLVQSPAE